MTTECTWPCTTSGGATSCLCNSNNEAAVLCKQHLHAYGHAAGARLCSCQRHAANVKTQRLNWLAAMAGLSINSLPCCPTGSAIHVVTAGAWHMTCLACGPRPLLQLFNSTPVSFRSGTVESQMHLVLLAYDPSALLLLPATPALQVPCTPRLTRLPEKLAACRLRSHLSKAWDCIARRLATPPWLMPAVGVGCSGACWSQVGSADLPPLAAASIFHRQLCGILLQNLCGQQLLLCTVLYCWCCCTGHPGSHA